MGIRRGWYTHGGDTLAQIQLHRLVRNTRSSLRRWMRSRTYLTLSPRNERIITVLFVSLGVIFHVALALL